VPDSAPSKISLLALAALAFALIHFFLFLLPLTANLLSNKIIREESLNNPTYLSLPFVLQIKSARNITFMMTHRYTGTMLRTFFYAEPIGSICALIALYQIRRSSGRLRGRKLAVSAILVMTVPILLLLARPSLFALKFYLKYFLG